MNDIILVIAAHPDDEALGCGGTMARHTQVGEEVHVLFLADGESSRDGAHNIEGRNSAAENAAAILGCNIPRFLGLPDNRLDTIPLLDIVKEIEKHIVSILPTIIYTHHGGDLNVDHQIAHQAVLTACRPMPGSNVRAIYGFETLSSTEWASPETSQGFKPTRFINITDHLKQKMVALKCYANEMRPFPHARSYEAVEALARFRGVVMGLDAAEAFSVIREIVR